MLHSSALCPYSTKAKSRVKSTISVLLWRHFQSNFRTCLQNSSNQDLYVLMPTVPKVTHNGQESTFPWHASSPCPEYAPIRFVRYRISDFTLLCFVPIQHESEKHGEKHGFCVICVSLVELWWVSKRSNCKQSQALFTKNEVSMTNFQNVHCCASSTVGFPLVWVMQQSSVWILIRKGKHTQYSIVSVLFKPLCTLHLKPRDSDRTVRNSYIMHRKQTNKKKIWHKSLTCPECGQLSLVYRSVHETYAELFLLHHRVAFCSPHIPGRKKTKNIVNMPFSV